MIEPTALAKSPSRYPLFGVSLYRQGLSAAIHDCEERIRTQSGGYVCFVNVHSLTESADFAPLKEALQQAFLAAPDGMPLVWASRFKGKAAESRVCGPDFVEAFLNQHRELDYGLIGGKPGVAQKLAERFQIRATTYSPPMRAFSEAHALEDWNAFLALCPDRKPPQVVLVGLGAPKQELWMKAVSAHAHQTLFLGVGAVFDFFTGNTRRAPVWMQKSGLEWSFRLMQEPRRLWKRYLATNSKFVWLLCKELIWTRPSSNKP